jgi:hypothetical protein
MTGSNCCTRKYGARVHREEVVELLDCGLLDRARLRDSSVGDEDVQSAADDGTHVLGQRVWSVRCPQVGRDLLGFPTCFADFGDNRGRFLFSAAVVDEYLGAGLCQRERAGASDAA